VIPEYASKCTIIINAETKIAKFNLTSLAQKSGKEEKLITLMDLCNNENWYGKISCCRHTYI
jgi:hypothetical protein